MREIKVPDVRRLRGADETGRTILRQIDVDGRSYASIAAERGMKAADVQSIYMEARRAKRRQEELGPLAEMDDSSISALRCAMKAERALMLIDLREFLQQPGWRGALASAANGSAEAIICNVRSFALANGIMPALDSEPPKPPLRLVG